MKYILDTNTFIEAKGRYYAMEICPGYWQWLLQANTQQDIISIEMVKAELMSGTDALAQWARDNDQIFISEADERIQECFSEKIIPEVYSIESLQSQVYEDFFAGADPWLIATTYVLGGVLVTHEVDHPAAKRKIHMPTVCKRLDIPYINTFEMLHRLEAKFVLADPD